MWTSYSVGRISPSEGDVEVRDKFPATNRPNILYVHGAGEVGDGWMKVPTRFPVFQSLTEAGFVITAPDLGGAQTWGNDTAQARITTAYNQIQTTKGTKPGKVILVAQSMGGLNSFIWAKNNPDKVAAIIALIPVVNLTDVYGFNTGYAGLIDAAYGGSYSEAVQGPTRNPLTFANNGLMPPVPIQLWYGLDDLLCKPQHAIEFAELTNSELNPVSGGHVEATMMNINPEIVTNFALTRGSI